MIGKHVRIKKENIEVDVEIVDRIMTNMAYYTKAAIMNNASFEVYVGKITSKSELTSPLVEFIVSDIIKLY
jgi:hypothetical protein